MKTKPAYLVIDSDTRTIKRVRQSWPELGPGEIIVRVALEISDSILPHVRQIEVDDPEAIAVAVGVGLPDVEDA